jgi:hypothetical protein
MTRDSHRQSTARLTNSADGAHHYPDFVGALAYGNEPWAEMRATGRRHPILTG